MKLVIGDKNYSSWSMRAWLMVRAAGVPFDEVLVELAPPGSKTAAIEPHSPSGRVPALRDGDLVVWESWAIGEYLAEAYPTARLLPEDRAARAICRSVSLEMATSFAALRTECPMNIRRRVDGAVTRARLTGAAQADIARVLDIWRTCRAARPAGGPFLFGAFSLADAMYAPVVMRLRTYGLMPDDAVAAAYAASVLAHPDVRAWEDAANRETHAIRAYDDR